jgi:glycosidase
MAYNTPLLILYGKNISNVRPVFRYYGVNLNTIYPTPNPNYLIFDITISEQAAPGSFQIMLPGYGKGNETVMFELLPQGDATDQKTLKATDAIYQIVPDRFSNGNTNNDNPDGLLERSDLTNPSGIHGGDLAGISNHLDYISSLGITTIELTPLYFSDQFILSYERLAPSHFFRIDPRLGSMEEYRSLISNGHQMGLKTIQTLLLNQIGSQHPLVKDPPDETWTIPLAKEFTVDQNPYLFADPYAASSDKQKYRNSFETMDSPLVNQSNKLMRKHLIQHLIWWVKQSGVDGIRIEKTHLNQPDFLKEALSTLKKEAPGLTIIASASTVSPSHNHYWQTIAPQTPFTHITDAPLHFALETAFTAYQQFDKALYPLYTTPSADFLYTNATNQLIVYADQHQLSRAFTLAEKDPAIFRMMMGYIFTFRGIPSLLYGSEIMLPGQLGEGSGFVRAPLPGGWPNDKASVFHPNTLWAEQQSALKFMTRLLNWRKDNPDLISGKLTHFEPQNGLYIYLRETSEKALLVIINNNRTDQKRVAFQALALEQGKYRKGYDILSGALSNDLESLIIGPKSILMIELQP